MNKTYKTSKRNHFSLSTFKGYLSGTQNPKFSKIRWALSKNSTTIELLKCIGIGLYKAYIKAITVADTRNSCLSAAESTMSVFTIFVRFWIMKFVIKQYENPQKPTLCSGLSSWFLATRSSDSIQLIAVQILAPPILPLLLQALMVIGLVYETRYFVFRSIAIFFKWIYVVVW